MKQSRFLVVILIFIAILLAVKFLFLSNDTPKNLPQTTAKGAALPVSITIAIPVKLENKIHSSGTVLANEEVELKPEASGKILQINFKEGAQVSKGDLLVKINDADLQAQLKKLQLEIKLSSEQEGRQKKLLEINGISQSEYDISLNQLNSLKEDESYTRAQIAKTELRAPFNGVIGLKNVSEGSYVSPSQTIAWFQQVDPVKIDFSIPEKYSSLVRNGDKLTFTASNSRDTMKGVVYAVQPRIDASTRTLQVRALSPNKDGKIIPGSFVKVELALNDFNDAIMLPTEAIVPVLKGKNVFLYKEGKAESRKIETGIRTESKVQVVDGVLPGDTIITSGIMQLRQGMSVKLTDMK